MSDIVARVRTGRRLHLYSALLECGTHDGKRPNPGTAAAIWHRIDTLHATGGPAEEIHLLEGLAVELHMLGQRARDRAGAVDGDPMPRVRIAELTRQWLAFAPLSA